MNQAETKAYLQALEDIDARLVELYNKHGQGSNMVHVLDILFGLTQTLHVKRMECIEQLGPKDENEEFHDFMESILAK